MTEEQVTNAVVQFLNARLGILVIQADQSKPDPDVTHVAVRFTGLSEMRDNPQGDDFEDLSAEDVLQTQVIESEWRFSLHAYGPNPVSLMRKLRAAVHSIYRSKPLLDLKLELHEVSQIRNVPEYFNEQWQPRAQMDLYVRGLTKEGDLVDVIEQTSFAIGQQDQV